MEARSRQVLRSINRANGARYTFDDIVAVSPAAVQAKELAQKIAATDATVLLASESGTGKELYAQAIHNASPRQEGVFVAINCSNFNAQLLDSELFGYAEGAFTGARKGGKVGLFEAADGGTLFLDEVSEMDISLQAKLLRALQEHRVRPVGAVKETEVDVRVIAACNADLPEYVRSGKFRKDLYYRLNTFPIRIPPLRDASGRCPCPGPGHSGRAVPQTAQEFSSVGGRRGAPAGARLAGQRAGTAQCSGVFRLSYPLGADQRRHAARRPGAPGGRCAAHAGQRTRDFEKRTILALLEHNGSSLEGKKKTAKELGISLATLYNKLSVF